MIQKYGRLRVADGSGERVLSCISVIGRWTSDPAEVGDVIVASVKQALPNSGVKKGDVVRAVVVRTRAEGVRPPRRQPPHPLRRERGRPAERPGQPAGHRTFGPVARELRERNYMKIVSLAPEVLLSIDVQEEDCVLVLAGKDRGKRGTVRPRWSRSRGGGLGVVVPGINMAHRPPAGAVAHADGRASSTSRCRSTLSATCRWSARAATSPHGSPTGGSRASMRAARASARTAASRSRGARSEPRRDEDDAPAGLLEREAGRRRAEDHRGGGPR